MEVVTSLVTIAILFVNIVYLLVKFRIHSIFIVMVYSVAFGCISNSYSSENISFYSFPAALPHAAGKRKNEMFSLLQLLIQQN